MATNNKPVRVSGKVYLHPESENIWPQNVTTQFSGTGPPQVGDIGVYSKLDSNARASIYDRQPHHPISGYFTASIYDGKKWRNFKLWDLLGEDVCRYDTQGQKYDSIGTVVRHLQALSGKEATWGERTYEVETEIEDNEVDDDFEEDA